MEQEFITESISFEVNAIAEHNLKPDAWQLMIANWRRERHPPYAPNQQCPA